MVVFSRFNFLKYTLIGRKIIYDIEVHYSFPVLKMVFIIHRSFRRTTKMISDKFWFNGANCLNVLIFVLQLVTIVWTVLLYKLLYINKYTNICVIIYITFVWNKFICTVYIIILKICLKIFIRASLNYHLYIDFIKSWSFLKHIK